MTESEWAEVAVCPQYQQSGFCRSWRNCGRPHGNLCSVPPILPPDPLSLAGQSKSFTARTPPFCPAVVCLTTNSLALLAAEHGLNLTACNALPPHTCFCACHVAVVLLTEALAMHTLPGKRRPLG